MRRDGFQIPSLRLGEERTEASDDFPDPDTPVRPRAHRAERVARNGGKENTWQQLRPELVVEVCYDHVTGGRFRNGTKLLRWRPDKDSAQCTMIQLAQKKADRLRLLK